MRIVLDAAQTGNCKTKERQNPTWHRRRYALL